MPPSKKTTAPTEKRTSTTSIPPAAPRRTITHEEIAMRAYEIYQARGGNHGRHEDDWQQAERELKLGRQ